MAYTDLWRCKQCNTLPEILMRGKNFAVKCKTCQSDKIDVYGNGLDEVVNEWNRKNDPSRKTFGERLSAWLGRSKR